MEDEIEPRRHKGTKKHKDSVIVHVAVPPWFKKTTMIKSLRKRHLQIWILWSVLLPAGIIVAYMSVPKKVTQELLQPPEKTQVFPEKSIDSVIFKTSL